jgi:hypothetical protein
MSNLELDRITNTGESFYRFRIEDRLTGTQARSRRVRDGSDRVPTSES